MAQRGRHKRKAAQEVPADVEHVSKPEFDSELAEALLVDWSVGRHSAAAVQRIALKGIQR